MKFLALLRGINVGGNNKVAMRELKICFQELGFQNVVTYINSGNIIFDSEITNTTTLSDMCEKSIYKYFGFQVTCTVLSAAELKESLSNSPKWWDKDDESKHNAIFVIKPIRPLELMKEIGEIKPEYESAAFFGQVIFWSAPIKTLGRTKYSKIIGTKLYKSVTIRNARTTKKLLELIT